MMKMLPENEGQMGTVTVMVVLSVVALVSAEGRREIGTAALIPRHVQSKRIKISKLRNDNQRQVLNASYG
jgi:hypothetical protein